LLSRLTQCPFAVKGGGHAAFAGGSSIEGGITIALEKLNEVTLSADKKTAAIGPGNRWLRVYETLEQDGLAVIGGRVSMPHERYLYVIPHYFQCKYLLLVGGLGRSLGLDTGWWHLALC
jgi:hypothetical protein